MKKLLTATFTGLVVFSLVSCTGEQENAGASRSDAGSTSGNINESSVILVSEALPEDVELVIEKIECTQDSERTFRAHSTRVTLADDGYVNMRVDQRLSDLGWQLSVKIPGLDMPSGYRTTILGSSEEIRRDNEGNISGSHSLQRYGDYPGQYGLKLDIFC